MKVAICDDENFWINKIKNVILSKYNSGEIEIFECYNEKELLNIVRYIDFIFLDINIPNSSGINIKDKLAFTNDIPIVFVTNYEYLWKEAFGKNVIGFVDKSNINEILHYLYQFENSSIYRYGYITIADILINYLDIIYIKADGAYIHIYTQKETHYFCISLSHIEQRLQSNVFLKIHRSYIVNLRYIKQIHLNSLELLNGETLALSKSNREHIATEYSKYLHSCFRGW